MSGAERRMRESASRLRPGWSYCALVAVALVGCDFPGQPKPAMAPVWPDRVLDFDALYRQNCSGCHGANGTLGPAPPLADPLFVQIIPQAEPLERVVAQGRAGTPMPPFAGSRGGPLTEEQVNVLLTGIREHWAGPATQGDVPAYVLAGDPADASSASVDKGAQVFARACASCHGESGRPGAGDHEHAGAIRDAAFLALTSDQALRRLIITGREDLGMPNFAGNDGRGDDFRPLSSQDVADLVALLALWRKREPGM